MLCLMVAEWQQTFKRCETLEVALCLYDRSGMVAGEEYFVRASVGVMGCAV